MNIFKTTFHGNYYWCWKVSKYNKFNMSTFILKRILLLFKTIIFQKKILHLYPFIEFERIAFIFFMNIPCDKTFPWVPFYPVTMTLEFDLFFENFWWVSAGALIFHMSIPCDKIFPWVTLFLTLWPWPWSLTYFL